MNVSTNYRWEHYIYRADIWRCCTDLWGEPVADRVHVVAGC